MSRHPKLLPAVLCAVAVLGILAVASCRREAPLPEDPADRYAVLLDRAWGPESPQDLERFLAVRRQLKPVFERFAEGIHQWALREVSTRPMLAQGLLGVVQLRRELDDALAKQTLTMDDYTRMTLLVYGRWLRAVRPGPPPEVVLLRTLQELEVGLTRHLANNPPEDDAARRKLEDRIASVAFQARVVAAFALPRKSETLSRIDRGTAQWLEQHRKEVEELDLGVFDTAAPPRTKPKGPAVSGKEEAS